MVDTFSQPEESDEDLDDDLDDEDYIQLDPDQNKSQPSQGQEFNWSEPGSTRRSSPLRETPKCSWEFEDADETSFDHFSSPQSKTGDLPDTVPLNADVLVASESQAQVEERRVDFSETASTMKRSSPVTIGSTPGTRWEVMEVASQGGLPHMLPSYQTPRPCPPASPPAHFPDDELYDATPPRLRSQNRLSNIGPSAATFDRQNADPTPPETLPRKEPKTSAILNAPKPSRRSMDRIAGEPGLTGKQTSPCPENGGSQRDSVESQNEPPVSKVDELAVQPMQETYSPDQHIPMAPKPSRRSIDSLEIECDSVDEQPSPCLESMRRDSVGIRTGLPAASRQPANQTASQSGPVRPSGDQGDNQGRKKKKQRAKTPIQFDEKTNEMKSPKPKSSDLAPKKPVSSAPGEARTLTSAASKAKKKTAQKPALKTAPRRKPPTKKASRPTRAKGKLKSSPIAPDPVCDSSMEDGPPPAGPAIHEAQEPDATEPAPLVSSPTLTTAGASAETVALSEKDLGLNDWHEASESSFVPPPSLQKQHCGNSLKTTSGLKATSESKTSKSKTISEPNTSEFKTTSGSKTTLALASEPIQRNAPLDKAPTPSKDSSHHPTSQEVISIERVSAVDSAKTTQKATRGEKNKRGGANASRVLAPRDPNQSTNRAMSSAKQTFMKKKRVLEPVETGLQHPRKARKLSRSFSVTETGSPLPLESSPWTQDSPKISKD